MNEAYLNLQRGEAGVATMAATIFAAYIQNGEINETNEDEFVDKAVAVAIKLVICTDKAVKSDEEWVKPDPKSAPML